MRVRQTHGFRWLFSDFSFYLACGAENATPLIFVHGWPELSISWRHQLPVFGNLGFRCIAPDMRRYGRSSVYARNEDYALEHIVADMIELLDSLGAEKAIWVGHDWGAPVVWSIAQHHPQRCHGVANLCVPYIPEGFSPETSAPLADRTLYPEAQYPAAQWDYMLFYRENFDEARAGFERNVRATVKLLFRAGNPSGKGQPSLTASIRARGGWFGPGQAAPDQRPWSQYFCCMVAANKEFAQRNPVATKRVLRAILKASQLCAADPDHAVKAFMAQGYTPNPELARQAIRKLLYGKWRDYNPEETVRVYALRLREAAMIKSSPQKLIAQGTDWRFLNDLKKEMKA